MHSRVLRTVADIVHLCVQVGIPTGYIQGRLLELLPEEEQQRRGLIGFSSKPSENRQKEPVPAYADPEGDKAGAVIAHLEASLQRSPRQDARPD
jgi:hypothetical protein